MRKGAKMQNDLIEKVEIPKDSFDIMFWFQKNLGYLKLLKMMRSQ